MKYYVSFSVQASYTAAVDAPTLEEAKEKAWDKYYEANFGDAFDIDARMELVESEHGRCCWMRTRG